MFSLKSELRYKKGKNQSVIQTTSLCLSFFMNVIKRSGERDPVEFDKITARLNTLMFGLNKEYVDPVIVTQKIANSLCDGITTQEIDVLAAESAADRTSYHHDYSILAGRIMLSNLHKMTRDTFTGCIEQLYHYSLDGQESKTRGDNRPTSLIKKEVYDFIMENQEALNGAIYNPFKNDETPPGYSDMNYFSYRTLEKSYLMKVDDQIVERPQYMLMRTACGIWYNDLPMVLKTYEMLSKGLYTHASPTLFNSGTNRNQMSSCFLMQMDSDSIDGIYDTIKKCALISKDAGGIGIAISKIRASGSYIRGTNGKSNGIIPMIRVINATARYVDQGGAKRKGAIAVYLEPWHADFMDFLDLGKNNGADELRARDLKYGIWMCDLFMKRAVNDEMWSFFCPDEAPGLMDVHSDEFETLYTRYEREGLARSQVSASQVFRKILATQIETGTPYMLYKDACNRKSNQQNLGCISSSNLCTEIIEYTAPGEIAVCNLASIALPKYVDMKTGTMDWDRLFSDTRHVTKTLDRLIDINFYALDDTLKSNLRHRPMAIGVQGLADVFMMLHIPYESDDAFTLNREIFETIYFAALTESNSIAKRLGTYFSYDGSPISQGKFQFDLWEERETKLSSRWDWEGLRAQILEHGVRNSLLTGPMPTASTSQILGNTESFEPLTSPLYSRGTLAGQFVCLSPYLQDTLIDLGLWTPEIRAKITANFGSVQSIMEIPENIRRVYKKVAEMKAANLSIMAAERGQFIDQSQSFNANIKTPTIKKLRKMHLFNWKLGLKTGMYYLRSEAASTATQFTVDPNVNADVCTDDCLSCGA